MTVLCICSAPCSSVAWRTALLFFTVWQLCVTQLRRTSQDQVCPCFIKVMSRSLLFRQPWPRAACCAVLRCAEVQLETPFSGGHAADLTNYSHRNGSFHVRSSGSHHRAAAVYGSQHGGSKHLTYATPAGSRHGVSAAADVAASRDAAGAAGAAGNSGGLYASNGHTSSKAAVVAKGAAGDQAV